MKILWFRDSWFDEILSVYALKSSSFKIKYLKLAIKIILKNSNYNLLLARNTTITLLFHTKSNNN